MHSFRTDFRDDSPTRLRNQRGIESIGATHQEWVLAHRVYDPSRKFFSASGGDPEARVRPRHSLESHPKDYHAASINRLDELAARHVGPERDLLQNPPLDVVFALLITLRRPTLVTRERQHRGVLARAVVVQSRGAAASLSQDFGAALRRGLVRTTGEITFLETDVVEHFLHERDVLGLTAVGRARHREVRIIPAQCVEAAGSEEWNYLERLGARSPEGKCVGVARCAEKLVSFSDYRGVYSVLRLGSFTAGDSNIELVRFDHNSRYPS